MMYVNGWIFDMVVNSPRFNSLKLRSYKTAYCLKALPFAFVFRYEVSMSHEVK